MTLIAATLNYKRPVVISDTLWTTEGVKGPIPLPGVDNGYFQNLARNKVDMPIALIQKMYFVNDNICIVFAGDLNEISTFLPKFKEHFPVGSIITNESIHHFLHGYNLDRIFKESSFFIFYVNKDSNDQFEFNQFYFPQKTFVVDSGSFTTEDGIWNILEEPVYQETWAHATGAHRFLKLINQPMLDKSGFPKGDMMRAIQMNAILVARLHALQTTEEKNYTLIDDWGGAFEIGYFNGQEFEKLNKYSYLICYGQFDESGDIGIPWPMYVLYYQYIKGVLFITELSGTFNLSETDSELIFTSACGYYNVRLFEILSIDGNIPKRPPTDLSFTCEMLAVGYSLTASNGNIFNPAFFNIGSEVKVVYRQNRHVKIFIDKNINDEIGRMSKEQYLNRK
jgi:hypothetical protein